MGYRAFGVPPLGGSRVCLRDCETPAGPVPRRVNAELQTAGRRWQGGLRPSPCFVIPAEAGIQSFFWFTAPRPKSAVRGSLSLWGLQHGTGTRVVLPPVAGVLLPLASGGDVNDNVIVDLKMSRFQTEERGQALDIGINVEDRTEDTNILSLTSFPSRGRSMYLTPRSPRTFFEIIVTNSRLSNIVTEVYRGNPGSHNLRITGRAGILCAFVNLRQGREVLFKGLLRWLHTPRNTELSLWH